MSYARMNQKNVAGSIASPVIVAGIAIWQFYLFVTFRNVQGGDSHLWWAIATGALACATALLVFRLSCDVTLPMVCTSPQQRVQRAFDQ